MLLASNGDLQIGVMTADTEAFDASPQGGALIQGDADCSGAIDAVDALVLLRHLAAIGEAPGCLEAADVDCNGALDATDALKALRFVAGLAVSQSEPCPEIGEGLEDAEGEPLGVTSEQLIAQALEAGHLDEETALLYSVYAEVNTELVPLQYRGDDRGVFHGHGLDEAREQFDTLSPAVQDAIRPYLLHPFAEGSIESMGRKVSGGVPEGWASMEAADGNVLIWWEHAEDQALAQQIASFMGEIWNELTALMQQEPLPDINETDNGGDGRLDIILTDELKGSTPAKATSYQEHCTTDPQPGYIRFSNQQAPLSELKLIAAHEFMHILQFAYKYAQGCEEYRWLNEATATWAPVHFLYPELKIHEYAEAFFKNTDIPLETWNKAQYLHHPYGASVFIFFLTKEHGDDAIVRKIYEAVKENDSLKAIDKTVPGGFAESWKKFLAYNWNPDEAPLNQYREWQEGFDEHAQGADDFNPREVSLSGKQDERIPLFVGILKHLSSKYYHFEFNDDSVSTVVVHNGWTYELEESDDAGLNWLQEGAIPADQKEGASLQALVKIEGEDWYVEDLSDQPGVTFCRDRDDERVEELVLIFGHEQHDDRNSEMFARGLDTTLLVSNFGCYGWEGTAETTIENDGVVQRIEATMTWESTGLGPFPSASGAPDLPDSVIGLGHSYLPVSGSLSWSVSGTDSQGCVHSASQELPLGSGLGSGNSLTTWNGLLPGNFYRSYYGTAISMEPISYLITCPSQPPKFAYAAAVAVIGSPQHMISANGRTMTGMISMGDVTTEWNLTAMRE